MVEGILIEILRETVSIFNRFLPAIITGFVVNQNGVPLSGAFVIIGDQKKQTYGDGGFIISIKAGIHDIGVEIDGRKFDRIQGIHAKGGEKISVAIKIPDSILPPPPPPPTPPTDPFEIFIKKLATFVHINTKGEFDMPESQKVKATILESPQNLGAAFLVVQSLDGIKQELLKKLRTDIENQLKATSYHFIWDKGLVSSARKYANFRILFNKQQDKHLYFRFEHICLDGFYLAITRKDESIVISSEAENEISAIMENIFGTAYKTKSSPWWAPSKELGLEEFYNWSTNQTPWLAIQDGTLADKIVGIADKVHAAFKDRMDLLMPTQS